MSRKKKSGLKGDFVDFLLGDKNDPKSKEKLKKSQESIDNEFVDTESSSVNIIAEDDIYSDDEATQVVSHSQVKKLFEESKRKKEEAKLKHESEKPLFSENKPNPSDEKTGFRFPFPNIQAKSDDDLALAQAENLRVAQDKILALEEEVQRLRGENEEIRAAAVVIKDKADEFEAQIDRLKVQEKEKEDRWKEDLYIQKNKLDAKTRTVNKLEEQVKSLELRLKKDLKMVRVRERELENRLEILKIENQAVMRSKDEHLLEMKREVESLDMKLDSQKDKVKNLYDSLEDSKDKIRRTVRALRLALSLLEESEKDEVEEELRKSS